MTELPARFWDKVHKSAGCWTWTGANNGRGYGQLDMNGKRWYAHRLAYEVFHGPLGGLEVDHICRNSLCVRPDHLRSATRKQNVENRGVFRNSKTGVRGVHLTPSGRWEVRVKNHGVEKYIGTYATLVEATAAAKEARNAIFTHNDADRHVA